MRTYYYRGITCPSCHEPHVNGEPIEIIDESSLRCTACGAKFNSKVNLYSPGLFPKTIDYIATREGSAAKKYLSQIPLVWKVQPNIIEQAYIDWLSDEKIGLFLITWPWRDVRFIPLLVFEYLLRNPHKSAAVIGNYSTHEDSKIEYSPSSYHTFTNMIYTVDAESVSPEIKKESNKLDRGTVFEKEKVVEVKYKKIGSSDIRSKLCHKTLRICKNEIHREDSEFKDGFLRRVIEHKLNGKSTTKEIDENGMWDVTLAEQERWSGDLSYKKVWLWEVLTNSTRLISCNSKILSLFYGDEAADRSNNKDIRLHYLSSEPDLSTALESVQEISPDILIIENMDEIISDSRFGGEVSKTFLRYLNECSVKTVLMFSANPDMRQFYKLKDSESIFHPVDVIPHTWDSAHIINNLPDGNESKHPNPISSIISQLIEDKIRKIDLEYIIVNPYNKITDVLGECSSNLDVDFKRDVKIYFRRVVSTPLNIKGDYRLQEFLVVHKWGGESLTCDIVMSRLYETLDHEAYMLLDGALKDTFQMELSEQTNPLRTKIISTIKNILDLSNSWYITVVVYPFEVKGTERLLMKNDYIQNSATHVSFCGWKDLISIEGTIPEGFRHCVISTRYPSIDYSLYFSSIDRFIFIGDEEGIGTIREILEKRLLEANAYPIIKPDDSVALPDLLRDTLRKIDIPDTGQLSEIYEDVLGEGGCIMPYSEITDSYVETEISGESRIHFKIKTEEPAILCIDSQNRGLFLPFNHSVLIKDGNMFQEISFDNNPSLGSIKKELMGQEIILGRSGFYISIRSIFFEFMMERGKKLQFQRGPFEWSGFKDLYNDSIYWIRFLEKTVRMYSEEHSFELKKSQKYIAKALAESEITAINPNYIIRWWTNYEEITIDFGTYKLYRIEHPFTRNDMRTIFSVVEKLCPGIGIDIQMADRSYAAAVALQSLRRNALKSHNKKIDLRYSAIYYQLENKIMQIMRNTELFRVSNIYKINVLCEVEPLRIFENYRDFVAADL